MGMVDYNRWLDKPSGITPSNESRESFRLPVLLYVLGGTGGDINLHSPIYSTNRSLRLLGIARKGLILGVGCLFPVIRRTGLVLEYCFRFWGTLNGGSRKTHQVSYTTWRIPWYTLATACTSMACAPGVGRLGAWGCLSEGFFLEYPCCHRRFLSSLKEGSQVFKPRISWSNMLVPSSATAISNHYHSTTLPTLLLL